MRTIAQHLVTLGYRVTFITSSCFRSSIEAIGATCYVPSEWKDFNESSLSESSPILLLTGPVLGINLVASRWFINAVPIQFNAVQGILESSHAENPSRPIVLLPESSFLVSLPILLDAPGLRPEGVISIGNSSILEISPDTPPPSSGRVPDSSPKGLKRNEELNKAYLESTAVLRTV